MSTRAVLSAGSNVGDSRAALTRVVDGFGDAVVAVSDVYATAPWGGVEQDDFLNITLIVEGPAGPYDWLARGVELEQASQRTREVHWGPRTLDVDVITVDDADGVVRSADPTLILPHPRAHERAFVLVPWYEIDPAATLWTDGGVRRVDDLVAALDETERAGVRRLGPLRGAGAIGGRS